jgi:hypothetical protein
LPLFESVGFKRIAKIEVPSSAIGMSFLNDRTPNNDHDSLRFKETLLRATTA